MSEHEPDEPRIDRALIEQARPALGPSDAQRARLKRAVLAAAVGSAAAGTAAVASGTGASATTAGVGLGTKIAIAVFAVAAVGGGAWLATRDEAAPASSEVHEPVSAPPPIEPAVEPGPVVAPPPTIEPAAEPVPVVTPPSTAQPEVEEAPARDSHPPIEPDFASIERETELLREAHAASQRGDARAALALLEQHARQFPRGALAAERRGLRILALCDAGEVDTARREVPAFLRGHPPAGLAQRVARSCAGDAPPEKS